MSLALQVVEESGMSPSLDEAIRESLCECFPASASTFAKTRAWHGSTPSYSLVHREGARVVGHVGVIVREIVAGGTPVTVAGIQSFAVIPNRRGTGLSRRLMEEAMVEAKRHEIPFGLLFCVPGLERFYISLGWRTLFVRARMVFEGAETEIPAKNIAMALPLAARPFPSGDLHLGGPDW